MKPYPAYESSGIDWIGKIPTHWGRVSLKWISTIYSGGTPDRSKPEYWEYGDIPWLNSGSVNDFIISKPSSYITELGFNNSSAKTVEKGNIVIALAGQGKTKGMAALVDFQTTCNQSLGVIKTQKRINNKFLLYYLTSCYKHLRSQVGDNKRDGLNLVILGNFPIPLPSINEQNQIADYLEYKTVLIDKLIANNKKKIALLKEKKAALINRAVTKGLDPTVPMKDSGIPWIGQIPEHWLVKKTRFVFSLSTGISITKSELVDTGIDCINYGDIHTRLPIIINQSNTLLSKITEEKIANHNSAILQAGNFVFCDTSEDLEGSGNFVMVKDILENKKIIAGSHTILVKPISNIHSEYFAYLFHSKKIKSQIEQVVKGVKVYSITQSILKNIFILIPPIKDQIFIANYLEEKISNFTTLIDKYNQKNKFLIEYRQSLINNAVTGKIDLRDEVIPEEYIQG